MAFTCSECFPSQREKAHALTYDGVPVDRLCLGPMVHIHLVLMSSDLLDPNLVPRSRAIVRGATYTHSAGAWTRSNLIFMSAHLDLARLRVVLKTPVITRQA